MGVQNTMLQHPRYGFSEQRMVNQVLTEASLTGTSVERPAGTRFAVGIGDYTLNASSGEVQLLIEGSCDGSNWFTVARTASGVDNFTGTSLVVLNAASSGQIDLQRFQYIRARAVIASGTPDFDLQVIVTAFSDDSEKFLLTDSFTRSGATPTSQTGDSNIRPSGTVLTNVQVTASGVVLDGATAFDVTLQGSPDGGTTWIDLASASVSGNGSQLMSANGETLFSLSSYATFRFVVADDGVAGAAAAFTIDCYLTLDSVDWTLTEDEAGGGGGSPFDPANVFIAVEFGTPTAEVGNARNLSLQLLQADGSPLAAARRVELILYDTSLAGSLDLAATATFTAATVGTIVAGTGTNRLLVTTNSSGQATVTITDAAVETTYCTAVNPSGPQTTPQIIVEAAEVSLSYT